MCDWAERPEGARVGAERDTRACDVDRLARERHLRIGITVILQSLDGTLACSLLDLAGQGCPRANRQIVAKLVAHIRRQNIEPFEPDFFNGNGIVGNNFRRRLATSGA